MSILYCYIRISLSGNTVTTRIYNPGHNNLRLFNVLPNYLLTTTETKCNY